VASIAVVIAASRLVVRPVLKAVASYGGREVFTAAALLLVVGARAHHGKNRTLAVAGRFLAGMLLADSEFRPSSRPTSSLSRGCCSVFSSSRWHDANWRWSGTAARGFRPRRRLTAVKFALMYGIARIGRAPNETAQGASRWRLARAGIRGLVLFAAAMVSAYSSRRRRNC